MSQTINANNATIITYGNNKDILKDWISFNRDIIQRNAMLIWEAKDSWKITADKQIISLLATRGELTRSLLNEADKKAFMQRKHINWLGQHCLQLLNPYSWDMITIHKEMFTWYHSDSGKTIQGRIVILQLFLERMCPVVCIKLFEELKKMRKIKPVYHSYDIVKWLAAMKKQRMEVNKNLKDSYMPDLCIEDVFTSA